MMGGDRGGLGIDREWNIPISTYLPLDEGEELIYNPVFQDTRSTHKSLVISRGL
jgi:hypothetical protein